MLRFAALALLLVSCVDDAEIEDGQHDTFETDGKADGGISETDASGVLAYVNQASTDDLRGEAHVTSRVANNVVAARPFATLKQLDDVPYVGPATLTALIAAAKEQGFIATGATLSVIFSPQPAAQSSNAHLAELIRGAKHSVDIMIYSYSDAGIAAALKDAVARGVQVRFLYEVAGEDKGSATPATTKSGAIEGMGVDVRYVNQVLHHKVLIVDGPRDDASRAATATVVMGSANWSNTGSTVYDENTITIANSAALANSYQHEFDILWKGSRDFAGAAKAQPQSTGNAQPAPADGVVALFTSANFTPGGSDGATWKVDNSKLAMASQWIEAIAHAQKSIHIASTHLRMKPIVDALIAKHQADPTVEIEVYLDQQEFTSSATDDALYSKYVSDAGIAVKYKSYMYRWDAATSNQMHSKYLIVDGNELISGSYNLSDNSEHGTFENALHVTGKQYAPLVAKFEANFSSIYNANHAALAPLQTAIKTSPTIPMAFDAMALTWKELSDLKALIRANCTAADTPDFRKAPAAHKTCVR